MLDPSGRYGPDESSPVYRAEPPEEFLALNVSGAQRLRNGNTLITDGPAGRVFEVTPAGEKIWEYDSNAIVEFDRRVFRADRYFLSALPPTGMVVDETISGNWFDPDRDGEGYVIEVLDDGRVVLVWFTFPPNASESDKSAWMIGVGYFEGDHIVVENLQAQKGAVFGAGFDKDDLVTKDWGRVEMIFDNCDAGEIRYSGPPEFGDGFLPMQRLTALHDHSCTSAEVKSEELPDSIEASLASEAANGAFYQSERNGEGWLMEYLGDGRVVVQWFTYNLEGNPARLTGVGRIDGSIVVVEKMLYVTGTEFGAKFDPDDIDIQDWGFLSFEFHDCDKGRIAYFSRMDGWGSGVVDVTRLISIKGISCDWPPPESGLDHEQAGTAK